MSHVIAELLDAWTRVRCLSRQTPPATPEFGGDVLVVRTGEVEEPVRRVILRPTPELVAAVLALAEPNACAKWPGDPADWPSRPPGWVAEGDQWLMSTQLGTPGGPALPARSAAPDGYVVAAAVEAGRVSVDVVAPDGEPAAHGQAGIHGDWHVPDRIRTQPGHQRRGLGSVVMRALAAAAAEQGATRGVLVASPDGRQLYERLEWRVATPVVAVDFTAEA